MRKYAHCQFGPPAQPDTVLDRIFTSVLEFHDDPQPPQPLPPPEEPHDEPEDPQDEPEEPQDEPEEPQDEPEEPQDELYEPQDEPQDELLHELTHRGKSLRVYSNGVAASAVTPKTAANIANSADAAP